MTKQEIIDFISKNPSCNLATVEGDKPHVRGILTYRTDEKGIVFHTGTSKDLYKQIQQNANVEMCFFNSTSGLQVRVSGKLELLDDMELKKEIVANRPFLKPWMDKWGWDFLVVYRLPHGTANTWTMATNLDPKTYIEL